MIISEAEVYQFIITYLLVLFRIMAMFMVIPVFGSRLIPQKIRLISAISISVLIVPTLAPITIASHAFLDVILMVINQIIVGVAIGFCFQMVFQVFVIAGQIIAMQAGLGFASLVDPSSGSSVPLVSQFYLLLSTLIFLALNGHLLAIEFLASSFKELPVTSGGLLPDNLLQLITYASWMFKGAVLVSLPAIISLLLVNITFGILARATPQLNIFAIGFPISLTLGLILVYLTLSGMLPQMERFFGEGFALSQSLVSR